LLIRDKYRREQDAEKVALLTRPPPVLSSAAALLIGPFEHPVGTLLVILLFKPCGTLN